MVIGLGVSGGAWPWEGGPMSHQAAAIASKGKPAPMTIRWLDRFTQELLCGAASHPATRKCRSDPKKA
jgi:hypothetical protein